MLDCFLRLRKLETRAIFPRRCLLSSSLAPRLTKVLTRVPSLDLNDFLNDSDNPLDCPTGIGSSFGSTYKS